MLFKIKDDRDILFPEEYGDMYSHSDSQYKYFELKTFSDLRLLCDNIPEHICKINNFKYLNDEYCFYFEIV